jgi:hypothetical protein
VHHDLHSGLAAAMRNGVSTAKEACCHTFSARQAMHLLLAHRASVLLLAWLWSQRRHVTKVPASLACLLASACTAGSGSPNAF